MLIFLILWFASSIIFSLLFGRIIGRASKINLNRQKSFGKGYWYVKDSDVQKANWYINECPPYNKLDLDRQLKKETLMEIGLN